MRCSEFDCVARLLPEKPHLSMRTQNRQCRNSLPKRLTCAGNAHSKTEIFPAPAGLSGDIDRSSFPKSLTYAQFVCRSSSRKSSPLARSPDCGTYPEEAHLTPIEVDEPPFRSRKLSPLQRHSRRIALLAGKTGFVSRKSSHQSAAKSRETSPFGKIA